MIKEQNITRLIIILPITFILITVITTMLISIKLFENHFKSDIKKAERHELRLQKQFIKNQIDSVYNYIEQKKLESPRRLKKEITKRVYTALDVITQIYESKQGKIPEQEVRKEILETLRKIRFGTDGYYFVAEIMPDNTIMARMIPSAVQIENTQAQKLQDRDGKYFVQEFANVVTMRPNNEGFVEYKRMKIGDTIQTPKLSFVKLFKPYNWIIGYGEYYNEFNKSIKEEAIRRLDLYQFGESGYIWTHDINHHLIQHPFRKKSIGINDFELSDQKGTKIIQLFVKEALSHKNGAFIEYYWNKPNEKEPSKKLGYVRHIKEWDWVIGTGVYLEDIKFVLDDIKQQKEKDIKDSLLSFLGISFITLLLAVVFSYIVSKRINLTLLRYRKKIIEKQEELKVLNDSLEIKVQSKTEELQALNASLEETIHKRVLEIKEKDKALREQSKMVALGEMIGNISHQWRQPLSTISTSASGLKLKQEMEDLSKEDIIVFSDAIVDNANYLSQVIEDFKNYIKGDKIKEPFSLNETIKKSLNIVNSSIQNHNITVVLNIEENIIINSYENELLQGLVNILTNSKDAYVMNKIEDKQRFLFINLYKKDKKAIIEIKDAAKGIAQNILNRIFEPYFTTKEKNQGTGLGLYMTYQIIIDSIRGNIEAYNKEYEYKGVIYKGVVFKIEIPLN